MRKINDPFIVSYIIKEYTENKKSMNQISKDLQISDSTVKKNSD